jgi:uncharacterized protein (DUF2267 family)
MDYEEIIEAIRQAGGGLSRVAGREGTELETALRHARAMFAPLSRALSPEAVEHLAAALPQIYKPLVAEAQAASPTTQPGSHRLGNGLLD